MLEGSNVNYNCKANRRWLQLVDDLAIGFFSEQIHSLTKDDVSTHLINTILVFELFDKLIWVLGTCCAPS